MARLNITVDFDTPEEAFEKRDALKAEFGDDYVESSIGWGEPDPE